MSVKFTWKQ